MKLLTRTFLLLLLMLAGSWIGNQQILSGLAASVAVYAVYLLIGIVLGSMASPRFTKAKNKWIYILPILIFAAIGALMQLSPWLHAASWPFGVGNSLLAYSNLSWSIAGFFLSLALR